MAKNGDKRSLVEKLQSKYRLSIFRGESLQEVVNLKVSRLNVITIIGAITIVFLIIVVAIIAYTPVRELIPGYHRIAPSRPAR